MDFNYSRSLEELGQYALDKSRLRVDLMYLGSLKKGEIRGYSTEAFKFVKYKNKEVEMEPLCQTKTKGIWRKFLYGETTLSGTHQQWQIAAATLTMIIKYSCVTAISCRDLSQKGIQAQILIFPMILCQYWFICLTLDNKIKVIFSRYVLIMEVFWATCCSEQFNLLIQTNSELIRD